MNINSYVMESKSRWLILKWRNKKYLPPKKNQLKPYQTVLEIAKKFNLEPKLWDLQNPETFYFSKPSRPWSKCGVRSYPRDQSYPFISELSLHFSDGNFVCRFWKFGQKGTQICFVTPEIMTIDS